MTYILVLVFALDSRPSKCISRYGNLHNSVSNKQFPENRGIYCLSQVDTNASGLIPHDHGACLLWADVDT